MENKYPDAFLLHRNGGNTMEKRFEISTVVENGHPHYRIHDYKTGKTVHCDFGELNITLDEMMEG